MMTLDQFFGLEKDNPHDHIRWFNKITSTIKYKDVLNSAIKLLLFPFSLTGAARRWLEKEPPHSILTWEDLVSKSINEFFPPSPPRTKNLRNEISNFQQRFDESFHEAWDRYKDLLRACPHHGFTELHQLDAFYNALNPADQESLNSAVGGNTLERRTQDVLTIIKNKSKVRNSRNKSIIFQVKSSDANSSSSSEIAKLTHAVNQQTTAVTTTMTAISNNFRQPHLQLPYVAAATVNYNQGNFGYRPPGVANQIRPPGFAQPNVQNNQSRFGQPQGYNRGNNFNPEQSYQAPTQQNQVVPLSELEKVKRRNEANMKVMQTQINNVKNELRNEMKNSIQASMSNQTNELKNMMASFFQMNTTSTSGSGSLPSNTIANLKGELKSITTRSGIVLDGPSIPIPPLFINLEEDERVEETLTDQDLVEYTIKVPHPLVQKSKPPSQINFVVHQRDLLHTNIPYPSRMHKQKQQEKDKKMLKALLSNKEKLLELENTPLNENCSSVILKKLPEKLGDPRKFLLLCGFSELKCKDLADLGASINLMPLSVWKKLGLLELISTRMTLELANQAICTPAGIARDVFVLVGKFTFTADFIIVDYESDPRVPLILGRPFLQTARALIDVHGEEMILQVKDDVFNPEGGNVLPEKLLDLDSTEDLHPPHNEFADELALITFPPGNDDLSFDIESDLKEMEYLLHHDPIKDIDSILKDSIDQSNLVDLNDNLANAIPEMFTEEHALEYSSPSLYDEYDDDLLKLTPEKNVKKLAISYASLILEAFDPPLYELPFFKEVPGAETPLSFSSKNRGKVFKPGILTSKGFHSSLIPK
uniref:Retrotransposon gag domain-containing protein n=1 Tax=Tanacetum cinerariifolium TaxID=118510 RepID=A0A6L2MZ87_TANCI|nr:hypothetical protein [Tanacetum cinerariifolium]